jgi:hypothetical protein
LPLLYARCRPALRLLEAAHEDGFTGVRVRGGLHREAAPLPQFASEPDPLQPREHDEFLRHKVRVLRGEPHDLALSFAALSHPHEGSPDGLLELPTGSRATGHMAILRDSP